MWAFFHSADTVPVFHDSLDNLSRVPFAVCPMCLSMSLLMPSGPGAFLHFRAFRAASSSSIRIASVMHQLGVSLAGVGLACYRTAFVLSLGSLTVLSSWYVFARVLAAFFPV